jgi:Flp pilus assembly protein TadD
MTTDTQRAARPDALMREQIGTALRSGDVGEAQRLLRKRLREAPHDADAMVTLADIAVDQGNNADALSLLYRALGLAPDAHQLRLRLASLHQHQGQFPAAVALFQQVPAELRQSFELRAQEAALLGQLGRRNEEIAIYDALVREQPRNSTLWMTYGNTLNYAGRRSDAVTALRKAISLQATFGEPWWSLANLKSFRFEERDVTTMQKSLRSDVGPVDALHFHFALGRAFEERGDYQQSFDHYVAGNRLRAASIPPAQMRVTPFVDAAIATFSEGLFSHYKGAGCDEPGPVFVIGLQRSGSTLIEQILASHAQIEGTAELLTMQHLWDELAAFGARNGRNVFEQVLHSDPAVFRQIGQQYLERTKWFRLQGRPLFIDKLPANWMNVGLIRLALPNAKIIDARRNPMACGFSNFKQHYASGVTFSYSLDSIGHFYCDYLQLMRHFDSVQPGAILHVLNEQLIDSPEAEVRRMLDFIGVPFDASCLEFHRNKRAVHTPSAEQVRRPINREGVSYWRNYEPWLDPLKQALGTAVDDWEA